jgi:hypothetical protein
VNYKIDDKYVPLRIRATGKTPDGGRAGLERLKKKSQKKHHGKAVRAREFLDRFDGY